MAEAPVVVAIDGPAASGKGTLARRLAAHLGFAHLDTGLLYRATARRVIDAGGDAADGAAALRAARSLTAADLQGEGLREETVTAAASVVAANAAVRAALFDYQRGFAAAPPDGAPGAVLEGRDIGTVVCPDARVKIFLDAHEDVRARRRLRELLQRGAKGIHAEVLRDLRARDARDRGRAAAPLAPAEDAFVIDSSTMDADEVFRQALALIDTRTTIRK
ncbi:MAG: (d)CMP kinase [Defluviicoccus sp.]|nr:(d)CMP kinase [Defluviicoccus sp.]MDE0382666.1 (d)CMP kinase [Defluviicoccus sp.]